MISRRVLPFAGWTIALACLISLIKGQVAPPQVIGIAGESTVPVSSLVPGRLKRLAVAQHQVVSAGDVIATLDDTAALLDIEAALLDIEQLREELGAEKARLLLEDSNRALDEVALRRRLELDRLDARLLGIAEVGRRQRDAAELLGSAAELKRVSALAGDALAARRLDEATATHAALTARQRGRDALIEASESAVERATSRLSELPDLGDTSPDPFIAPILAAIVAAQKRIEAAYVANEERTLRAPIGGKISAVLQKPGEAVGVDEPVVMITAPRTSEVTAWVHEDQLKWVEVGRGVEIRGSSRPDVLVAGAVASRGPAVLAVPDHALTDRGIAEFGVPVLVSASSDAGLVPGERVAIRFARR